MEATTKTTNKKLTRISTVHVLQNAGSTDMRDEQSKPVVELKNWRQVILRYLQASAHVELASRLTVYNHPKMQIQNMEPFSEDVYPQYLYGLQPGCMARSNLRPSAQILRSMINHLPVSLDEIDLNYSDETHQPPTNFARFCKCSEPLCRYSFPFPCAQETFPVGSQPLRIYSSNNFDDV